MYKEFIKPILFLFSPEFAHDLTMFCLSILLKIPGVKTLMRLMYRTKKSPDLSKTVFGITFKNPVGLAGGLDKNGEYYNELANFGFGFVEIGSLTAEPQSGNPRPRLFRLPEDKAIINRMGINNKGVRYAAGKLRENPPKVIVAANIAKNSTSHNEDSAKDYETAFSMLYDFVDMFVINVSCPNVAGLVELQDIGYLSDIMDKLIDLRMYFDEYRPILIKVSPDIPRPQLDEILDYSMLSGIDGIVAGNTTKRRDSLVTDAQKVKSIGDGGLSGAPLHKKNVELVRYIYEQTQGNMPIVGVGGIMTPEDALEMFDAGASLIEIYTGFIYEGPSLVKNILKALQRKELMNKNGKK